MPFVMLKQNWPKGFHRCVRDGNNNIIRTLDFSPGAVLEVDEVDLPFIVSDIGRALLAVEWSQEKRKYVVIDHTQIDFSAIVKPLPVVAELPQDPPADAPADPPVDPPADAPATKASGKKAK